jgi:ribosomal protein S27E
MGDNGPKTAKAYWRCPSCGSFREVQGEDVAYCEDCGDMMTKEFGGEA